MSRLNNRVRKLEANESVGVPHVVMWHGGMSFNDALANSSPPPGADKRMLIHVRFMSGGHGKPIVEQKGSGYDTELTKAQEWACGAQTGI